MANVSLVTLPLAAAVLAGGVAFGVRRRRRKQESPDTQRDMMQQDESSRSESEFPDRWPFRKRPVTNAFERDFWQWLREVFPGHHVLVKLPLARFLVPGDPQEARTWARKLLGVYCTFTVCTGEGNVIGCLDIVGPAGLPRGNRHIKETLLAQCGIGYWPVAQGELPDAASLRADFLGLETGGDTETGASQPGEDSRPQFSRSAQLRQQVRDRLNQVLDRNRSSGGERPAVPDGLENPPSGYPGLSADTPPSNSFLSPLQSRRAGLDQI